MITKDTRRLGMLVVLSTTSLLVPLSYLAGQNVNTYYIVDTHQQQCYDTVRAIAPPSPGQPFYGQDAQHLGNQPKYHDNGDGTVSDSITGLMWVKARGSKVSWEKAMAGAAACAVGGYGDWRMPTIKELYSLIDFRGRCGTSPSNSTPYIDTAFFGFAYGNIAAGERIIDCQDWSATTYVHFTMNGDSTAFGVNFADGRIKSYGKRWPPTGARMQLYVRYVRGNPAYGINNFQDNGDSTVTDRATGLMWAMPDSRAGMNWRAALAWVQAKNAAHWLGYGDWRLPDAKELQSIVDYTRSPATSNSAAIDPLFRVTEIGSNEYPYYWTGTTHLDNMGAVYICFGRGLGWMQLPPTFTWQLLDVHGAGCQRSDPKTGDAANYPHGLGPQGDVIRIESFVRLVRSGAIVPIELSFLRATALPGARIVRLEWTTEREVNNAGFRIERRPGEDGSWVVLPGSFTAGQGTTDAQRDYSFTDRPPSDGRWYYRLQQIDIDGKRAYSRVVGVVIDAAKAGVAGYALRVYPNPVGTVLSPGTGTATIGFELPREEHVRLRIFDVHGREMAQLVDDVRPAGLNETLFECAGLPSGMYFCRLESSDASAMLGMILLR